jgi:hypothetical protein
MVEALMEVQAVRPLGGGGRVVATSVAPGIKLFPIANRSLMAGMSVPLGLGGELRRQRGLMVSAFYHF